MLSKEEGGRHTPFFNNYRPQFYFRTTDVTGSVTLPAGHRDGDAWDNVQMTVTLIAPIAMEQGCGSPSARAAHRGRRRRRQLNHRGNRGDGECRAQTDFVLSGVGHSSTGRASVSKPKVGVRFPLAHRQSR